ncbi:MAG: S-layer homology domain-containing protein [Deltaproteobacteria bacterium]
MILRKKHSITVYTILFFFVLTLLGTIPAEPIRAEKSTNIRTAFNDVAASDPNALYIKYIVARGIITGFPDGSYHPQEALTRAQAAVIFTRIMGLNTKSGGKSNFKDIPANYWAAGSITAASQAGYIKGIDANNYKPEAKLTRAQGISLFMKLSKQPDTGAVLPTLNDINNRHWAARPVAMALDAGMIGLSQDKKNFYPDAGFNRGDLARMLAILLNNDPALSSSKLTATLTVKKGEVKLQSANKEDPVTGNSAINPGDSVITGENGEAEINLPDGSGILIKANTRLTLKNNQGRTYIKKDGGIGTRVDNLEVELKQGRIFGALASKHDIASKAAEIKEKAAYMVASLATHLGLAAANPWYKTAQEKKVKVKVDMPWGVSGIRGSFWSNQVSEKENSTSLMTGEAEVTATEKTEPLAPGQATTITGAGQKPSPATAMGAEEQKAWDQEKTWIDQRDAAIEQNQEMTATTPSSGFPGESINTPNPPQQSSDEDGNQKKELTSKEIVEAIVIDRAYAEKTLETHPDWGGIHSFVYLDTKNNIAYKGFAHASDNWTPTIQRFRSPKIYTRETIPADVIERMKKANSSIWSEYISKGIYDKYILGKNYDQQTKTNYQCAFPVEIEGDIPFEDHLRRAEYPIENLTFEDM